MDQLRTYVITGASSNLGRALAQHFAAQPGTELLITSRRRREDAGYENESSRVHYLPEVDLLRPNDVAKLKEAARSVASGPFCVLNCVGLFRGFRGIGATSVEEARAIYESNVLTVYATASALLPLMVGAGGGHFMVFSSHAVFQAYPLMAAFTSAKAALESLVRSIANEYGKDGIVATALALATVDSPEERQYAPSGDFEHWLRPRQICEIVESLTNAQSPIMNGNTIQIFNYSGSYFGRSYYDRIGHTLEEDRD